MSYITGEELHSPDLEEQERWLHESPTFKDIVEAEEGITVLKIARLLARITKDDPLHVVDDNTGADRFTTRKFVLTAQPQHVLTKKDNRVRAIIFNSGANPCEIGADIGSVENGGGATSVTVPATPLSLTLMAKSDLFASSAAGTTLDVIEEIN